MKSQAMDTKIPNTSGLVSKTKHGSGKENL